MTTTQQVSAMTVEAVTTAGVTRRWQVPVYIIKLHIEKAAPLHVKLHSCVVDLLHNARLSADREVPEFAKARVLTPQGEVWCS